MVDFYADVAVIGGGVSGFAAALAAAREGKRVLLAERLGSLGGMLTAGCLGFGMDFVGKGGICAEIQKSLSERKALGSTNGPGGDFLLDIGTGKELFLEMTRAAGVEIAFHSSPLEVELAGARLVSCRMVGQNGEYRVTAEQWIDATGDGVLSKLAGCSWENGQEGTGRHQPCSVLALVTGVPESFHFRFCEEDKDSLRILLQRVGHECSFAKPFLKQLPRGGIWTFSVHHAYDVTLEDPLAVSIAYQCGVEELSHAAACLRTLPGWQDFTVVGFSEYLGVRDSRRICGEYRLSARDLLQGSTFPDGVCTVHQPVDIHSLESSDVRGYHQGGVIMKPYEIPLRALRPQNKKNLFTAGRCISGDFLAEASYRVAGNAMATGEAAGYAAATGFNGEAVKRHMRDVGYALSPL